MIARKFLLALSVVKARLAELSAEVMTGSAAEFRRFIEAETEKWGRIVKFFGAKVD